LLRRIRVLIFALATIFPVLSIPDAIGEPPQGAHITNIEHVTDHWDMVSLYSSAMDQAMVSKTSLIPVT
jgi:diacylglycerol O-acyltransferase/trehalose O-mycolyltransferase